jgi:hypothetical protein
MTVACSMAYRDSVDRDWHHGAAVARNGVGHAWPDPARVLDSARMRLRGRRNFYWNCACMARGSGLATRNSDFCSCTYRGIVTGSFPTDPQLNFYLVAELRAAEADRGEDEAAAG